MLMTEQPKRDLDEQIRVSSPSTQWMVPGVAGSACPAVENNPTSGLSTA